MKNATYYCDGQVHIGWAIYSIVVYSIYPSEHPETHNLIRFHFAEQGHGLYMKLMSGQNHTHFLF